MKSVIIVGGGIAGLGAARRLGDHGVRATVLEAKDRWGGRIHTLRHGGIPVELGAEFVHGKNPRLLELISEAGGQTQKASAKSEVVERGDTIKFDVWEKFSEVAQRLDPHQPDLSFADHVAGQRLNERARAAVTGFVEGFHAADTTRISAHSLLRADYSSDKIDGSWQGRLINGYGGIIDFMVHEIESRGGQLVSGTSVREIKWSPGHVEVLSSHDGNFESREADAAIITLPLGVLKAQSVRIRPALPGKFEAIQQMQMGNVVKVILAFRRRWWDEGMGFVHSWDEAFPTWWSDPRAPILTAWAGGPHADALLNVSEQEMENRILESLCHVIPVSAETFCTELKACYYHNWGRDPEVRGAYSYMPVNGLDLPKALAAPVKDTLFFAGEATVSDAQTGTTFGALESGMRAADEILESRLAPSQV